MRKLCAIFFASTIFVSGVASFLGAAKAQSGNTAVYVDSARILSHFSRGAASNQESVIREANSELKRFASAYQIDVIFQRATYVSRRVDVTEKFIGFVGGASYNYLDVRPASIRVAFVDSKRLFDEATRRGFRSSEDAAKRLNLAISQLAEEEKIDLVFDNAVWAGRAIDISERVLLRFF